MCTYYIGKVYSVGDGLCYEGQIKNQFNSKYHFVLDCGNKTPTCRTKWNGKLSQTECDNRLDEITDEIALNESHINLFILTHFHYDHYSGYKKLFKKTKIDTIIMPYLYPEERLCLIVNNENDDDTFLANPYSEILNQARENNDNVKLILIRGNDNGEYYQKDMPYDDNPWGKMHEDIENILELEDLDLSSVSVIRATSTGNDIYNAFWKFKLFNYEVDESKLIQLRKFVGKLTAQDLYNLIRNSKAKIKAQYDMIAKYLSDDLNNTSIIIYHAPIKVCGKCGTIITGDIDLNFNLASILKYYNNELKSVGLFSLPHHGSYNNWNKNLIDNGNLDNVVCFASTHNYYTSRLTGVMMSDLRIHNISVLVVDENRISEFIHYFLYDDCVHYIDKMGSETFICIS